LRHGGAGRKAWRCTKKSVEVHEETRGGAERKPKVFLTILKLGPT